MKNASLVIPFVILVGFPGLVQGQAALKPRAGEKPGVEIGGGALYTVFPSLFFVQASVGWVPAVSRWGIAFKINFGEHDYDKIVVGSLDIIYNLTREGPTRPYLFFGPAALILNDSFGVWVDAGAGIRTRLTKSNSLGMYIELRVVLPWNQVAGLSGGITIRF